MSNDLAFAAVTAVLADVIGGEIQAVVPGATVSTARPEAPGPGVPDAKVHLFLYHVTPNAAWRNRDLPSRDSTGRAVRRPQAAFDLQYVLSFVGDDSKGVPQRLLGTVARVLHTRPVLTRDVIAGAVERAVAGDSSHFLGESDLADQIELVRFSPVPLTLEDVSKVWSVFFQVPYALSVVYAASVVLIDGRETPRAPPLVRSRALLSSPARQPRLDRVSAFDGPDAPIVPGSVLLLTGRHLASEDVRVRVGAVEVPPVLSSDSRVTASLDAPPFTADGIRAGVQGAQVVHAARSDGAATARRVAESNVVPFVLRPVVTDASTANVIAGAGNLRSADVVLEVSPRVQPRQRVVLVLHATDVDGESYAFHADSPEEATDALTVRVHDVRAGKYIARVQVDGAESVPGTDAEGRYATPEVDLT